MAGTPLTCIITCYNPHPHEFRQMLESLAASTFKNFDVIVVDDASRDQSHILSTTQYFPQMRAIVQPTNRGLAAARNAGVQAAHSEYFLQFDQDDILEPTFIEKVLWALDCHPQWAFCNSWHQLFGHDNYDWPHGFEGRADFLDANQAIPAAIIRRQAHIAIGGYDETIREGAEDWDYWLRMAAHGYWGGTLPEFLIRYRTRAVNSTQWPNRDNPMQAARFRNDLRQKYGHVQFHTLPKETFAATKAGIESPPVVKRSPNHILLLMPWMILGGAEQFNITLLHQLSQRGYTFTLGVTAPSPNTWLDKYTRFTQDYFILPNFLSIDAYGEFLVHLLQSRPIDTVVITASMLGYGLLPYLRAHFPEVVFIDFVHMVDPSWREGGYARVAVNQQHWLDLTLTASQHAKNWMVAQGAETDRVEVCHINTDTDAWQLERFNRAALRHDLRVEGDTPIILFAARLAAQKRPQFLLNLIAELHRRGRNFKCIIAGDGPELEWTQTFVRTHKLGGCVELLGAVEPERVAELMAASDIFLLPSAYEGIALGLYEAMAMGLPVVSADVGGQRELVTPETGFLITPDAHEEAHYLEVLERLLDSPELRQQVGRAAMQRVREHFNITQMTDGFIQLLEKARRLSIASPRTLPDLAAASLIAHNVLQAEAEEELPERMLAANVPDWSATPTNTSPSLYKRLKKQVLRPLYLWGLANGLEWLVPLKNTFRRIIKQ